MHSNMNATSAEVKEEVSKLQSELATMPKEQAQMDALRQKTPMDYVRAKADLEQGFAGVCRASANLRGDHAENDETVSSAQQPATPGQFSQEAGSATSIIGILEVVTQENKITKASKDGGAKRGAKVIVSS